MASNYKNFLEFTCKLNLKLENKDHKCIIASNNNEIIFDKPGNNDKEKIYFLKLEKMYLDRMTFPVIANKDGEEKNIKFALVYYRDNPDDTYFRLRASNIIDIGKIDPYETVPSHSLFCSYLNNWVETYVSKIDNTYYYHLYVPCFDIKDGKITCSIIYQGGKGRYICSIGFNQAVYDIIGKYFDCEWGKRDEQDVGYDPNNESDKTNKYYVIQPFIREYYYRQDRYTGGGDNIITAAHQLDDFFYPERNLDLEFTRNSNTLFDGTATSYKKFSFPFRNKEGIVELNKQILIANNTTIKESNVTKHIFRMSVEIDSKFYTNTDINIRVTGKLIPLEDIYDQFSLYDLKIYDLYSDEQLLMLSYRQIEGMQANMVYVQNQENTKALKEMRDLMQSVFDPFTEKDDCNIPRVLRRIFDILCQTQEITNMGPPLKQKIKYSVDF